ncbi:flagellar basal body rod protein FlgC [Robbsia andropogonis]|uniref:Flagellar basal-body rod protein FlgC n=1 Tax=Robbsia andropogonis TaxID=28092 RepID=A0A0F5K2G1_9BURK|nr:flagellar basal body rod protein FlgC [Robbsia andropogonis]KKB64316.1 flagellar basal body rod protein FlgC [Robbsia andropogonis]MCP1118751.1 flagellar basal body rod protein FlgC [Robbsia andropogonis]MCP1128218.1 flagellar basal body rod protein FlgC [Robbsia andropogonis]
MSSMMNIFRVAGSAMNAESQRLNTTASNLANVDSVAGPDGKPYVAKQVVFQVDPLAQGRGGAGNPAADIGGVKVSKIVNDPSPMKVVYDPSNAAADANGYVTMPNVDPVREMVNMISASRSYQANVETMNTAKSLMLKTLTLGQ